MNGRQKGLSFIFWKPKILMFQGNHVGLNGWMFTILVGRLGPHLVLLGQSTMGLLYAIWCSLQH